MEKSRITLSILSGCLLFSCTGSTAPKKKDTSPVREKPNIIFIMSDDLGYGDIGCFGQQKIQTPNIDRIANEGIRFTNAYAGSAVCAPSRSTLMQGLHTGHARVRGNMINNYREGLHKGDYTVAMLLKEAGYTNGLFGKWGLGLHDQYGIPRRMGFDAFYGYLNQRHAHNFYPEFLWNNETREYFPENGCHHTSRDIYYADQYYDEQGVCHPLCIDDHTKAKYSLDVYSAKSLEFVRNNKDDPFFLYLAYTPPQAAFIVPELGIYNEKDWPLSHKIYAAMITRMDNEVGKLLDLLAELGIDNNTLIFFTSDNGNIPGNAKPGEVPTNEFFNNLSPTRGGKGDIYNGAFHVPAMARWPKYIKPLQVSDHIWAFYDFLPTVADIVGIPAPSGIDGISILPTLLGNTKKQKQHEFLYWEFEGEQAVKMGNWYGYRSKAGTFELYDLIKNPAQDVNLAEAFPDIVKKINGIMKSEHTPGDVWPSPGESDEEFKQRMQQLGITAADRPANVAEF